MSLMRVKVALAGQPNCGKSTIFNLLTGARQHVANYPGVTVTKKSGRFHLGDFDIELVDLPGTYSLTSFSEEERTAREFLLEEKPDLIINVIDASNPSRNLYLTSQLVETEIPMLLVLNMMDVAERRGMRYDLKKLSETFNFEVISTIGKSGKGKRAINEAILSVLTKMHRDEAHKIPKSIDFKQLNHYIETLDTRLQESEIKMHGYPTRWFALKLLENDKQTRTLLERFSDEPELYFEMVDEFRESFEKENNIPIEQFVASRRYDASQYISETIVTRNTTKESTISDKIDRVVLSRYLGAPIMLAVIYLLYELSIVQGYEVTNYTWPILAWFKQQVMAFLPPETFDTIPIVRDFGIWMVNSLNALFNYIPIFLILFSLIAILEDSGYMARMAFLLDRIFKNFGLHGQSTLPYVMSGVFVGGCAVPGIMASKGIADSRARMATILTIPFLNCLAKIPFFVLIVSLFFVEHKTEVMFFISTITIIMALIIAKILSLTILKHHETAPFIMEMPSYHIPTVKVVLMSAFEKVWMYLKKVVTVVAAVAVVLFVLIQFPGVSPEKQAEFDARSLKAYEAFNKAAQKSKYYEYVDTKEEVTALVNFQNDYKQERMMITDKDVLARLNEEYAAASPVFFKILRDRKDRDAKIINKALRKVTSFRKRLFREVKEAKIDTSYLGQVGRSIETVTKYAGFDWRINVAFLSSFAARESFVATLGALFENENTLNKPEQNIMEGAGYTPLAGLAMIVFMALTPPCIATMIVLKTQTGSYKWMVFALFYPIVLALFIAIGIYSGGTALGLGALEAMGLFYLITLGFLFAIGYIKPNTCQSHMRLQPNPQERKK